MKYLLIICFSILTFFSSSHSFAKSNNEITFQASENANLFETKVCIIAATKGYKAAKEYLSANGQDYRVFNERFRCNGTTLHRFSLRYREARVIEEEILTASSSKS